MFFCNKDSGRLRVGQRIYLILATLLAGSSAYAFPFSSQSPLVGAHRGGVLTGYSNTLAQFKIAEAAGVDIIETDLRLTKDGIPVLFHDGGFLKGMKKETHCSKQVSDYTLAEIKKCRYKTNNEEIPSFEEVLKWSSGKIIINAEFKEKGTIAPALALIRKYQAHHWVYFQTGDVKKAYEKVRAIDPYVNLILRVENEKELKKVISYNDPYIPIVEVSDRISDDFLKKIHDAGKLASTNSFLAEGNQERVNQAYCSALFKRGFDILIADAIDGCVKQRNNL